jgi:hypothetical protein
MRKIILRRENESKYDEKSNEGGGSGGEIM